MFVEPHSTKHVEDALLWSADVDAQTLVDTTAARLTLNSALGEIATSLRCPVHVIHETADRISHHDVGAQLAELTGGSLTLIERAGHGPMTRDPVRVNMMIRDFIDSVVVGAAAAHPVGPGTAVPPESAVPVVADGLGHARCDLAITRELCTTRPDLDICWLAQSPVTRMLEAAGEQLHPASRHLLGESDHVESEAGEHDLHAFPAIRRMDEILITNFMLFTEVVHDDPPDLVVADEAWEVDYFLHENPELKRFAPTRTSARSRPTGRSEWRGCSPSWSNVAQLAPSVNSTRE
jgi:hypothetical protein